MKGTLYLCATPIGNLGDVSQRFLDTLSEVDIIACEDTRVTIKLLNHFNIKKKSVKRRIIHAMELMIGLEPTTC